MSTTQKSLRKIFKLDSLNVLCFVRNVEYINRYRDTGEYFPTQSSLLRVLDFQSVNFSPPSSPVAPSIPRGAKSREPRNGPLVQLREAICERR